MAGDESLVGQTLLHYRITAKLGAGGMGEVYRAEDTKLDREVALKVVPEAFASDPRRLARFKREAKAIAALNHPNIVTIHSIEEDQGVYFLTMELVEGRTLDELVPEGGLSPGRVLEIAVPLAEALESAHQRGIIHRDLKPGNVMVTEDGRVKVLDFGLAKLLALEDPRKRDFTPSQAPTETVTLTGAGIVVGTVPYLSPEYLDGQAVDHRSDIFSLGVVLYEMVTGLLPFQGSSGPAIMSSILRDVPQPVSDLSPAAPLHLVRVIERCLAKDPLQRYQSVADVCYELRTLTQESGWGPPPTRFRGRWRRTWSWLAGALVAVTMLALATMLVSQWRDRVAREVPSPVAAPDAAFDPSAWIIAVIPSPTRSMADPDLAAVNEGLALTLTAKLTQLSQSHGLQIIPASTLVEEEIRSLDKARRELGVTLALSFDSHRLGEVIRVNAQLVDVPNQRQLSAATVDGAADDLLSLEEAVTSRVLRLLELELKPMEATLLAAGTANTAAYSAYLKARGYLQSYHDPDSVEAAARLFQTALRLEPDYAEAHAGLGEALWRQYQISNDLRWVDAALEKCTQAVALDELEVEGHLCLGMLYNGTGRFEEAVREFKIAKSLDASQDRVFKGLADAFLALGDLQLAEDTYQEAIDVRPHYWAPYNWLGIFYHRQGRVEEAVTNFSQVIRLAPDSYLGYSNLGAAYYFAGERARARENFERALAIKDDDDLAMSNLGTLSFFEGRYEEATQLFERALEINDRDCFNWGQLADAYFWSKEARQRAPAAYRRAISLCQEQLVINPKDAVLLSDLAYFHAMLGAAPAAQRALRRAQELLPSDVDVQHRAAQVYQALGQPDEALEALRRAIGSGYPRNEIEADPLFAELGDDPRFRDLLKANPE